MPPTDPHPDFFAFLHGSHRHLEESGKRLVEAVSADARDETIALWRDLESQLLAHLEAEERYVLPAFARADREEAMTLLRALRAHADREERLMYTWAAALLDDKISGPVRRHVAKVTG